MHSKDATVLIDLMSSTTPACFNTFFDLLYYGPYCLLTFFQFRNTIIMIMITGTDPGGFPFERPLTSLDNKTLTFTAKSLELYHPAPDT